MRSIRKLVVFQCTPLIFLPGFSQFFVCTRIFRGKLIIVDAHTNAPWVLWSEKKTTTATPKVTYRYNVVWPKFQLFFFITLWILFEIPCQIAWFLPKKFTPFSVLPSVFNGGNFYRSILGDGVRLENTHVNSRQLSHAEWNEKKNCSISGKWVNEKLIENCGTNAFS